MKNKIKIDNLIKNFNRKLESYYTTFGASSSQYQNLAVAVQSTLSNYNVIKRQNGKIQIKRSKDSYNIPVETWHELSQRMSKHDLRTEKRKVMNEIRELRKSRGLSAKAVNAKVTFREIKAFSELSAQMTADIEEAMQFFYDFDKEQNHIETIEANRIMIQSHKTYSDLMRVLGLARTLQEIIADEGLIHEDVLSFTIPDDSGVTRWDSYERGMV